MQSIRWVLMVCVLALATALPARAQVYQGKTLVEPRLVADNARVESGKPFRVGLALKMIEGWHTYWRFPGDSGLSTKIDWTVPPGFTVSDLQWPVPEVEEEDGGLQVYVYKHEVLLMVTVTPPKDWSGPAIIGAKATWLVCEKLCVPGKAELALNLDGSGTGVEPALFEKFAARIPKPSPNLRVEWKSTEKALTFFLPGWKDADPSAAYFPDPPEEVLVGHPKLQQTSEGLTGTIPLLDGSKVVPSIPGVLLVNDQPMEIPALTSAAKPTTPAPAMSTLTLLPALLFGLIGGLILNLMPCVLPVISLKMFSFVKQAGESHQRIWRMGVAFAAGMFAWFLGIGVVLLLLRSAGHEISWAQQFQNPWFNIVISVVIFLFALNMLGVYEITLPGKTTSRLAETGDGYTGAFFQGMFATILGTPCTAPYLGTTLAFALTQPPAALLAVFASIAMGMSAPYLLLCANPAWMRFLPRPGVWMVRLKEFMGFLLLATLLWFVWIVGRQLGIDAVVFLGALLLLGGLAAWIYGTFLTPAASPGSKRFGLLGLLVIAALVAITLVQYRPVKETATVQKSFSQELEQALATKQPVFVDFTADWCLSCKVNKRVTIDSAPVQKAFQDKKILFMEGDWTNGDPEITRVLKQYGRAGVPLYLIYPTDRSRPALVLPELITPQIVLDALNKI